MAVCCIHKPSPKKSVFPTIWLSRTKSSWNSDNPEIVFFFVEIPKDVEEELFSVIWHLRPLKNRAERNNDCTVCRAIQKLTNFVTLEFEQNYVNQKSWHNLSSFTAFLKFAKSSLILNDIQILHFVYNRTGCSSFFLEQKWCFFLQFYSIFSTLYFRWAVPGRNGFGGLQFIIPMGT